jgi:hypothetical protein
LVEKPEWRRPLGRHGRRWELIVKWTLKKWGLRMFTGDICLSWPLRSGSMKG